MSKTAFYKTAPSVLVSLILISILGSSQVTYGDSVVATVPVGHYPFVLKFNPYNKDIYVANVLDGTVSVIDRSTNNVTATIPVGNSPRSLEFNPSNDNIYVSNADDNTVSIISTVRNKPPDCTAATPSQAYGPLIRK
jgi:YVTN family beta-propeller protein